LRAPIASVRLLAEALDRGAISEQPKQKEYFRFIVQECHRLTGLIENVLDFSRIEQGRKKYQFEEADLNALVEQTVKLMKPMAVERSVSLEISDPQPLTLNPQLLCDGLAVHQALVNLIDNAIKHSPAGDQVSIALVSSSSSSSNFVSISVTDHGPGIPAAEHEKIFERFYRRGSELRRETQGIGIGLTIVKHVAEAHGGRVTVESEVAKGSKFTIELPNKPSARISED
jgi:signal transduction histidine kinase